MSEARRRRIITDETRAKLRVAGQGRRHTQETRTEMAEARTTHGRSFWYLVYQGAGPDSCWAWCGYLQRSGYGVTMQGSRVDGTRRTVLAHRKAWELTYGPIPDGVRVLHRCDCPPCCNPAHLFLGTQADNVADMDTKGRRRVLKGEASPAAKVTLETVALIRRRYAGGGISQQALANEYGLSQSGVSSLLRGESWSPTSDW